MTNELLIPLRFDGEPLPAVELFGRLARGTVDYPRAGEAWKGLRVRGAGGEVVLAREGPLATEELVTELADAPGPVGQVLAYTALECWRLPGGVPEPASVGLWIETFGPAAAGWPAPERRPPGAAALRVWSAGPFCAEAPAPEDPRRAAANERVAENLENLTELLFHLVGELAPAALHVYSDAGACFPLNAHLAYYRSERPLGDDLAEIERAWRAGLPERGLPALAELEPAGAEFPLHGWRAPAARRELAAALGEALRGRDAPPAVEAGRGGDEGRAGR